MFVALLVPLMIPKVPYKPLNAIVFFGVFPIVGFMLLIGAALRPGRPLGALSPGVGCAARGRLIVSSGILSGVGKIASLVGLRRFFFLLGPVVNASYYAALPLRCPARETCGRTEDAGDPSLTMDGFGLSARGAWPDTVLREVRPAIVTTPR
jgi:hypothetical protein